MGIKGWHTCQCFVERENHTLNNKNRNQFKFDFDENVLVKPKELKLKYLENYTGKISGKELNYDGTPNYGVYIYKLEEVWSFDEDELESMGTFADPMHNKTGEVVKVFGDWRSSAYLAYVDQIPLNVQDFSRAMQ